MRHLLLLSLSCLFALNAAFAEARDTLRLKLPPPRLKVPETVLLTDSIPGAFIEKLDALYEKWYISKHGAANGALACFEPEGGQVSMPDSVYLARLDSLNSAIRLSYNDIVRNYIELYAVKGRVQSGALLGLADYYFPIFEEILAREGMPLELKYLPVIESALNPRAFSRAGACGLWQFMYATAKMYGLEITSFVDERCDPVKSSEAAARYLKDLYDLYEDWILVIAAYNCGPGNVNKAIRRSGGKKNYWDIYYLLPRETRGYVPAFIGAMYLFNYYDKHNIAVVGNELPSLCDTIMVSDALHFDQVTSLLDISVEQLRDLNPQYRADLVPAGFGKVYPLRMPYNYVTEFIDRQDTIFAYHRAAYFDESDRTADPRARFKKHAHVAPSGRERLVYTVREGDVIGGVAMKFGVRLSDLKYWNGMTRNLIRVGQKLVVYVPKGEVETYRGLASAGTVKEEPLKEGEYFYYTIREGENLWTIAKKFEGVTNGDLMRWNGLSERAVRRLKPGQKIKVKIL